EQLQQPVGLLGRVAPALGLDADLAAQGDRVDLLAGRLRDPQLEQEGGDGRVAVGLGVDAVEDEGGHGAPASLPTSGATSRLRSRTASKKPSIASHASSPPSKPFQCIRTSPTSS